MRLSQQIRARRYKRQFDAAVFTLLGAATYTALDASDRSRVDAEVSRTFHSSVTTYALGDLLARCAALRAQSRARAMAKLGIMPVGEGLNWQRAIPKGSFLPELDLFYRFRPYSQATADAKAYLRERGVDCSAEIDV